MDGRSIRKSDLWRILPKNHPIRKSGKISDNTKSSKNIFTAAFTPNGTILEETPEKFLSKVDTNNGIYTLKWKDNFFKKSPLITVTIDSDSTHTRIGQVIDKNGVVNARVASMHPINGSNTTNDVKEIVVMVQRNQAEYRRNLPTEAWTKVYIKIDDKGYCT